MPLIIPQHPSTPGNGEFVIPMMKLKAALSHPLGCGCNIISMVKIDNTLYVGCRQYVTVFFKGDRAECESKAVHVHVPRDTIPYLNRTLFVTQSTPFDWLDVKVRVTLWRDDMYNRDHFQFVCYGIERNGIG